MRACGRFERFSLRAGEPLRLFASALSYAKVLSRPLVPTHTGAVEDQDTALILKGSSTPIKIDFEPLNSDFDATKEVRDQEVENEAQQQNIFKTFLIQMREDPDDISDILRIVPVNIASSLTSSSKLEAKISQTIDLMTTPSIR